MAEEGGEQVSTAPVRIDDAFVNIKPDWCGLLCWRIENFTLVKWTNLGSFYTGDSYLVYHSYTVGTSKRVIQDIYFWLGAESSTDERGTAAIKAVELDDYFGGAPTQYREVQYHESERFRKLWESYGGVRFMEGGVASGFRKVEEEEGQYTLYQVKGAKNPVLQQVPCTGKSLNHGDVFILHKKGEFWIWFGKDANRMEKNKGVNALDALRSQDPKAKVNRLEGSETDPAFWEALGGETEIADARTGGDDKSFELSMVKAIYRVSPDNQFEKVDYDRKNLQSDALYIVQTGKAVILYIGKNTPKEQQSKAFIIGAEYLKSHDLPDWAPMLSIKEGFQCEALDAAFL